jgi:hypothetical protein
MVRTVIPGNNLAGAFAARQAPTTLDKPNGHMLGPLDGNKLILLFHLSAATAADTITLKAGVNPPAMRASIGDLVYTCAGGAAEVVIGPIENARYKQADGKFYIDLAGATIAGTVEAYSHS